MIKLIKALFAKWAEAQTRTHDRIRELSMKQGRTEAETTELYILIDLTSTTPDPFII